MHIGFVGLGRMGGKMAERMLRDSDRRVVGFDSDPDARRRAALAGTTVAHSLPDLVDRLRRPRVVWIMLPPGDPTRDTIARLASIMDRSDIVVDGGNSNWTDSHEHARTLSSHGVEFVDVGTSGGVWGLRHGYCLMVGGPRPAVDRLAPFLDVLAAPPDEEHGPGWVHVGPTGAGHYVKMVHNAIEYGLMEAYAEGFDLLDKSPFDVDKAGIAHLWMRGAVVRSWLCELAARSFEQHGNDLAGLSGHTDDSGQGRWALADAIARAVPTPVLAAAMNARFYSRSNGEFAHRLLSALRAQFGGHATRAATDDGAHRAVGQT